MKRILINASNLHVGGGVQVAASFITELYKLKKFNFSIVCSTAVYENLSDYVISDEFTSFEVVNVFGFKKLNYKDLIKFNGHDVCFTIFGPFYPSIDVKYHICGFAQAWIAYPNNEAYKKFPLVSQWKSKIKFWIQKQYFKKYDLLVVEQDHVKHALSKIGFDHKRVEVVNNCVSSLYLNPDEWLPIKGGLPKNNKPILGFIGRAYPHKNLNILIMVNDILIREYDLNLNFIFTLTDEEMASLKFDQIDNFYSVGSLSAQQCPDFYSKIDALIFPSLLECFSASPIEAMCMGTPVIASNRDFIKDICKDSAVYFDPLNPFDIAEKIVRLLSDENLKETKVNLGYSITKNLSVAEDRANNYVSIIQSKLNESHKK